LPHLENDAGDNIAYDLVMQLKMKPIQGDNTLRGKEEDLKFYTDNLYIDQLRGGVNTGGKMTRKRTIHDLRKIARVRQSEWWARLFDETLFMYLSGARGINADFIEEVGFTGYAGNSFVAPDAQHVLLGGDATLKSNLDSGDKMNLTLIERAVARAETMGGGTSGTPSIQPVMIDGKILYQIEYDTALLTRLLARTRAERWGELKVSVEGSVTHYVKGYLPGMPTGDDQNAP
jgi:N4-gp56 family major capsid protein